MRQGRAATGRLGWEIADPGAEVQPLGVPVMALADLAARAESMAPAVAHLPDPGDLALLQYTSGSTREPRGVPVTHRHLAANVEAIKAALGHDAPHESRTLSWLPLYHDMGLIAFFAMPMSCGCSLYLQSPASFARRPVSWLEAMSRYRITLSGAPNFAYALMTRLLPSRTGLDLTSVECLISGGEPVDAAMMARFTACGQPFGLNPRVLMPAYGLAEATLCVTATAWRRACRSTGSSPTRWRSTGRAVPGAPARAAKRWCGWAFRCGAPRCASPIGRPGSRSPIGWWATSRCAGPRWSATTGARQPPESGSWLRTGDLGYLADGQVVVCGREKDVLFAAGRNVYPQDVEAAAAEVPGVRPGGAAAFAVSSQDSERLVVAVEARAGDAVQVRQAVAEAVLNEVGLAADVVVVPFGGLPKTSSGKLRRAEARRRYVAQEMKVLTPSRVTEMEKS